GAFARPSDIERLDAVLLNPSPHRFQVPFLFEMDNEPRLLFLLGNAHGESGAAIRFADRQDERAIAVADVPLGALRITLPGSLLQRIALRNGAVLRPTALRTPAAAVEAAFQRHIEGGPIHPCLPAGDNAKCHLSSLFTQGF